jgi:hypothetical protein
MNPFKIFKIKPEERVQAAVALLVIVFFNALFIYRMHDLFMQEGFGPYWKVFERELHLSGYDPLTYLGVTDWDTVYNVYRHPLLAFLIWPLYLLNEGLTAIFGVNSVQYIVGVPVILASFYSYLFIYRIHREVIQLGRYDATLLSAFYFSFAYIMLSVIVPDHFTISMFMLLITLYISGKCIQKGREFSWWQSAVLFFITAGVTLSNGVKTFLSGFFVNLRDFFRPKYLLLGVILPAALLWGVAVLEYRSYVLPKEKARTEEKAEKARQMEERMAQMTPEERARVEMRLERREARLKEQAAKSGTPMKDYGFWKWTDITTSRVESIYENLFGEAIQFHRQHFLEDTLVFRPVFVKYDWIWSYVVEAIILLLAAIGLWFGRRSRFLWMSLSYFGFDMMIHLVLGFGINEIFIMAPHWMFVVPLTIAYAFRQAKKNQHKILQLAVLALTCYLWVYNGWLLISFLRSPIHAVL